MEPSGASGLLPAYAELHCRSNFTFLTGASHPEELIRRAAEQGYSALAITDTCSLAGVVRAHIAAKDVGLPLIIGAEFELPNVSWAAPGDRLILLAQSRQGYAALSELITQARRRSDKGQYRVVDQDLDQPLEDCLALLAPRACADTSSLERALPHYRDRFGSRLNLAAEMLCHGHDQVWAEQLDELGWRYGVPIVAAGDVLMHKRSRKPLQDVLTALRHRVTIHQAGFRLASNAEQHLRSRMRLAQLYPAAWLARSIELAASCAFSLDSLRYEYPEEIVPAGHTPTTWLRELVYRQGIPRRYPQGVPDAVLQQIEHELALIAELSYEPYFLTVYDLVSFARSQQILCQGRGSAANSAVCYCLGITEVDPSRMSVLFERFISKERHEPPDIDVDFEHQRREEVIQYLYRKYGRHRAALAATVISYRPKSALRDVGRVLGIDQDRLDLLSKSHAWWDGRKVSVERFTEAGFSAQSIIVQQWVELTNTLIGFPRHLSQHVGGFVIARDQLSTLVPIENAAMPERSVIQWDKDDLDALGLLKVDVLALGMLSAIRRALALVGQTIGQPDFAMQHIPAEDPHTYTMICKADTLGVFQIESRAQMAMLPRLRPRCFYDLVIEVAIVRPGPIQGGMVHPYLRRRMGLEAVDFPSDEVRTALGRTLGVPIFQEQAMQLAILAAGFTPGEADQLRRAMAAWKRKGGLGHFHERVINGMLARGYQQEFAERVFKQIEGFGEYGFPESHAASFALLVYVSCWLKCHHPAEFLCAMLNSQPLGFYAPAQLVRDAREHGVEVRPVDVRISDWDCTLEPLSQHAAPPACELDDASVLQADEVMANGTDTAIRMAVRLGLRMVQGLPKDVAERLLQARAMGPFDSVEDLGHRALLQKSELRILAQADALQGLSGHRHQAHWDVAGVELMPPALQGARFNEAQICLPAPGIAADVVADYASTGLSLKRHPIALLRDRLNPFKILPAKQLQALRHGSLARASGLVTHRQRPETAKGVVFITLEDDSGAVNVIVWPAVLEQYRREVLSARLMTVFGQWQRDEQTGGQVMHLVASRVIDHSALLQSLDADHAATLVTQSRDFH